MTNNPSLTNGDNHQLSALCSIAIVKSVGVISSIEGNLKEVLDEKKKKEADDYKERQTKNKAMQVVVNKC